RPSPQVSPLHNTAEPASHTRPNKVLLVALFVSLSSSEPHASRPRLPELDACGALQNLSMAQRVTLIDWRRRLGVAPRPGQAEAWIPDTGGRAEAVTRTAPCPGAPKMSEPSAIFEQTS